MHKKDFEICDECYKCKYFWKNTDTENECEGQTSKPCHEYSPIK